MSPSEFNKVIDETIQQRIALRRKIQAEIADLQAQIKVAKEGGDTSHAEALQGQVSMAKAELEDMISRPGRGRTCTPFHGQVEGIRSEVQSPDRLVSTFS